jgi:hypothetical protein
MTKFILPFSDKVLTGHFGKIRTMFTAVRGS